MIIGQESPPDDSDFENRKEKKEAINEQQTGFDNWVKSFFNHPDAGWFLIFSGGYGTPFLPVRLDSPREYIGNKDVFSDGNYSQHKALLGTNGGGWCTNFQFGHMHNSYLGWAIDFVFSDYPVILDARVRTPNYFAKQTTNSWTIGLTPMIVLSSGNMNNFYVYGKVGPYIPFLGTSITDVTIRDNELRVITDVLFAGTPLADLLRGGIDLVVEGLPEDINLRDVIELRIDARAASTFEPSVGIGAAVGFKYQFSEIVSMMAEARVIAYTIKAKQTSIFEFSFDGEILGQPIGDLIPALTLGDQAYQLPFTEDNAPEFLLTTNYSNSIDSRSNNADLNANVDYGQPADELAFRKNSSTIYANIGIQINIPKKEKEKKNKRKNKYTQDDSSNL